MRGADPLLPRPPGGMARGAGLALLVHGGLIVALTLGVSWRMKAPEVVSAELWAAIPEFAAPKVETPPVPAPTPAPPPPAPRPVESTPAPNEAQIAIERAERKKREEQAERDKAEEVRKKREADDKKKRDQEAQLAEQARREKLREDQIKRMLGGLQQGSGSPTSTGTAARDAAPSQAYQDRLRAAIRSQIIAGEIPGNPEAEVVVHSTASGTIVSRSLGKSSGVKEWDDAVLRAFDRLGTLPRNPDGAIPETMTVRLRPKE